MSSDQHRRKLQELHQQLARESRNDSEASAKAARARDQATRSSSSATVKAKLREAERYEKQALAARKKRATLDSKIAEVTKKLHKEESREAKSQEQSFRALQDELRSRSNDSKRAVAQELETAVATSSPETDFDFFISHASPDKDSVARPLAEALRARDYTVWLDEWEIQVGDSIRQKIDEGLRRSRFGVVILSRDFLQGRTWTDRELNGLFTREEQAGEPTILPIWHNVSKDEVARYSPLVADKAALKTADYTVDEMSNLLAKRVE